MVKSKGDARVGVSRPSEPADRTNSRPRVHSLIRTTTASAVNPRPPASSCVTASARGPGVTGGAAAPHWQLGSRRTRYFHSAHRRFHFRAPR